MVNDFFYKNLLLVLVFFPPMFTFSENSERGENYSTYLAIAM